MEYSKECQCFYCRLLYEPVAIGHVSKRSGQKQLGAHAHSLFPVRPAGAVQACHRELCRGGASGAASGEL